MVFMRIEYFILSVWGILDVCYVIIFFWFVKNWVLYIVIIWEIDLKVSVGYILLLFKIILGRNKRLKKIFFVL